MSKKDDNLKKLAKTTIPMNFVKKHKGYWEHHDWVKFCDTLKGKGYNPIDFDQVGLLLEKKKSAFLAKS